MGRIIVNPQASLFGSAPRTAPTQYGINTADQVSRGIDIAGRGLQVASMAGDIAGPIVVGLGNMGVEDQTRRAAIGLQGLQQQQALDRSSAARQMMASAQPQREPFGRRGMEEALQLPIVGEDLPIDDAVPYELPSQMKGMLQPGYQNPYRLRMAPPDPADSARSRAADLMLGGGGSFGQLGQGGDLQAFDQQPLDWGHQAPTDRRSIAPKSPYQPRDPMGALSPFKALLPSSPEQIPQGLFNAPQSNAMPQPGTPEFRAMIEQQQPTADTMSAGFGDGFMNVLQRARAILSNRAAQPSAAFKPVKGAMYAGTRQPSLQQRADTAQAGVDQQMKDERRNAEQALAPAEVETGEAIQTSEEMQKLMRDRAAASGPDAAEQALQARLQSAQNRQPVQVEDYDYSVPQLEALIIQAKQSGDPDTINKVAQAINASSLRGTRAQSVFADMLGGAHIGRERQRLLGNLSGVASKPESAADLAGDLSKATYQRRVGERMEQKPYEFIEKAGMNQGKIQLSTSRTVSKAPETAANVVARTAAARKAAAEAEMTAPKAKAQIASQYASANQANANANKIRFLTPKQGALLDKKIAELPRESKGMTINIGGKALSPEQSRFYERIRQEADKAYELATKEFAQLSAEPVRGSMDREQYSKMKAEWFKNNERALQAAAGMLARARLKKLSLEDAKLGDIPLADYVGEDPAIAAKIDELKKSPEFEKMYKAEAEKIKKEVSSKPGMVGDE